MSPQTHILIASDAVDDASLVKRLLRDEFEHVFVSTHPDSQVKDFETHRPGVLVLAFKTLEQSERYYLGLYRLSKEVHAIEHRTLILCDKSDLLRVYALCKKEYFDDYVLFWPMTHDAHRLPMAVHQALRRSSRQDPQAPRLADFAAQARKLAQLEQLIAHGMTQGQATVSASTQSLAQVQVDIDKALDGWTRQLAAGARPDVIDVKNATALMDEMHRLRHEHIDPQLDRVRSAVKPVDQWLQSLDAELASPLQAARQLQMLAEKVKHKVLLIDDDIYQHRLLASLLEGSNVELECVTTGMEALASLRKGMPDLMLVDYKLPDITGAETIRRLKAVPSAAAVPAIIITGQSSKDVVVESMKAGALDFLVKPFDRATLLGKLQRLWLAH